MKEQISALVDDEVNDLERERALRALSEDPALRRSWERYHLTRTVIRRELEVVVPSTLADRVQRALEAEQVTAHRWHLPAHSLYKFLAGGAIAATVATVAIITLPSDSASPTVATARPGIARSTVAEVRPVLPEQQRALNPYLVQHAEFAQSTGMNSLSGYARVVGPGSTNAE